MPPRKRQREELQSASSSGSSATITSSRAPTERVIVIHDSNSPEPVDDGCEHYFGPSRTSSSSSTLSAQTVSAQTAKRLNTVKTRPFRQPAPRTLPKDVPVEKRRKKNDNVSRNPVTVNPTSVHLPETVVAKTTCDDAEGHFIIVPNRWVGPNDRCMNYFWVD
jgi:hypothetical protein